MSRATIEGLLANAEASAKVARDELVRAREQLQHAELKHDESKSGASRRAVADARIDLESAERVERRSEDELSQARVALARLERSERMAQYEAGKAEIARLMGVAREGIGAVIHIDRSLDSAVMGAIVTPVARACDVYASTESLARELGLTPDLDRTVRRPSLAEVRLQCSREVTRARAKDQRDCLVAFVEQADLSWQVQDSTASDLQNREDFASRPPWTPGAAAVSEMIAAGKQPPAPATPPAAKEGDANGSAA